MSKKFSTQTTTTGCCTSRRIRVASDRPWVIPAHSAMMSQEAKRRSGRWSSWADTRSQPRWLGSTAPGSTLWCDVVDANCSLGVSGCRRLSPAICGEYARKLCGGQVLSLVTGLPPLVCKSIARASKLRILPSGDAYITDLVLDIAATASHTSVRPSKTAQRHPSARRRGPLPTAGCHSLRPARPSAGLQPRTLTQLTLHG